MARMKVCPRTNPPSSSPSPSPSLPLPPPSLSPPPLICTSAPAVKTIPSAPPPLLPPLQIHTPPQINAPPAKKIVYPGPFIKGQIGSVYFSLDGVRSYMEIPHGYSIIVQNFWFRFKHELCDSKYIIIDPLGNKWSSPKVFNVWRHCVENGEVQDIDLMKVRHMIVHYGNTFKLCTCVKKNKYKDQLFPIPAVALAEEDPHEKKDPDYVPNKDEEDELD